MTPFHLPGLEFAILIPLLGALWVGRQKDPRTALRWCLAFSTLTLVCALGAWLDFVWLRAGVIEDWRVWSAYLGPDVLVLDELSAPLVPLVALLHLLTAMATLSTKMRRFSFAWALASEAIALATLSCKDPWSVIVLLAVSTVPPWLELRERGQSTRAFTIHMGLFIVLAVTGQFLVGSEGQAHSAWAVLPLVGAVLVRSGMVPVHCWMTDLFEHATFGTALLFVTPIAGAYAAVRLVLPIAPDGILHGIGLVSLTTAVYAAGMALVQREARRFFCYLFLSHSALVLVGLEIATPLGLTGALLVWLAVALALTGFGLTLRGIEARTGRLSLTAFHGLYDHTPMLAIFFLLTGLASIGFPGTLGYLGTEMLVEGAVEAYPYVGLAVVAAAALNGIAVMRAFFYVFTGTRHASAVSLRIGRRERIAVLTLTLLILGGGLLPRPGADSRHHAAMELVRERQRLAAVEHQR